MLKLILRGMITSFLIFILSENSIAQITVNYPVKFLSWNILNFPNSTPTVDSALRCPEYRKVIQYSNPDLVVTMENTSSMGSGWFLSNVMNSGQGHFAQGTYIIGDISQQ